MKKHSKELWTKSYPQISKSKQKKTTFMGFLQLWFVKGVLFLSKTANVTLLCNFPWKQSVSFSRHKEWLLWQSLRAALPRGSGFRAELQLRRKFECLASCNSLREAEPRPLELQRGFLSCLSFSNEENSCVFSQGILNFSNHILLSHEYGQVKLKLNADLMSQNFSSDLLDSVSFEGLLCQLCYPKLLQIQGRLFPRLYEARYSLCLCKTIESWGRVLTTPAAYLL